jgi:hypothetical protein
LKGLKLKGWTVFKPHESHATEPRVIKEIELRSRLMEIDKIESEIAGFDFTSVRRWETSPFSTSRAISTV